MVEYMIEHRMDYNSRVYSETIYNRVLEKGSNGCIRSILSSKIWLKQEKKIRSLINTQVNSIIDRTIDR